MKPLCALFIAVLLAPVFAGADAHANSLLISPNPNQGQKFPLQGACQQNGIDPSHPNIDQTRATWSCQGMSSQMMRVFYREGPQDCVYIDNLSSESGVNNAFFVPMNTSDEWMAFVANLPNGVRLRYGCQGVILTDPCGARFALPDSHATDTEGDVVRISTSGDYQVEYQCPLTSAKGNLAVTGGCGEWKKVKESGNCAGGPAAPVIAPTNNPGATTAIPGAPEGPGPIIPIN